MSELSEGAKKILRYLKEQGARQMDYNIQVNSKNLFDNPEDCENAEAELEAAGLISLTGGPPAHIPVRGRVRAAALTLEGERYLAKNDL